MHFKKEEVIVIALAVILFLGFILLVKPSTTGYVLYTPVSNQYNYNTSLVNFSDSQIKLIPLITTTTTNSESKKEINTATQNGIDVLSKVNSLESEDVMVQANDLNKIINFNFSNNLEDNDIISVYFKHNKQTLIKICPENSLCSDAYSSGTYDGNQKWINFTLDLNSGRKYFGIYPTQENVKVDYIYGTHITSTTNTTITYPSSATIETNDIEPANVSRFDYINYNNILNNQNIGYYYSTDSGNNWINITEKNISSLNLTKIRVRAKLYSDGSETPIISSLSLNYVLNETTSQNENNSSTNVFIREIADNNLTYLKIYSDSNLSGETITINLSSLTNPSKEKLKAIEVNANINFSSAILKINYTNSELGNLNESTLKFYYYNSNNWEEITSTVNTNENYIEANLTHFSVYGIFGENNQQNDNQGGSGGGSSGGSGGSSSGAGTSSSGDAGNRAPSSRAQNSETKIVQNLPQKQKEEPKEIRLFEEPKKEEKQTEVILPTAQAVKEVEKQNYFGIYLFIALVVILYFVYHKHVKKANSKGIKKLKNHKFRVKKRK